jgi:uncharacterized cupin superfamily protein
MPTPSKKLDLAAVEIQTGAKYPRRFWKTNGDLDARSWQRVGKAAGLTQVAVNRVVLRPNAVSSLRHWHTHDDEFVVMLEGEAVMLTDDGETVMRTGDMVGFPAGVKNGHCFVNRSSANAVILALGPSSPQDETFYSDVDLHAKSDEAGGGYVARNGQRYDDTPE